MTLKLSRRAFLGATAAALPAAAVLARAAPPPELGEPLAINKRVELVKPRGFCDYGRLSDAQRRIWSERTWREARAASLFMGGDKW